MMVPFWVLNIIRHLVFNLGDPKGNHNFDNHPYVYIYIYEIYTQPTMKHDVGSSKKGVHRAKSSLEGVAMLTGGLPGGARSLARLRTSSWHRRRSCGALGRKLAPDGG